MLVENVVPTEWRWMGTRQTLYSGRSRWTGDYIEWFSDCCAVNFKIFELST